MQVAQEIQLGEERQFLEKLLEKHQAAIGENAEAQALFWEIEAMFRDHPGQMMIVDKDIIHLLAVCARMAAQHASEHIPWDTSAGGKALLLLAKKIMNHQRIGQ